MVPRSELDGRGPPRAALVTVEPAVGKVIATFGGRWSLKTVNVTGSEGHQMPSTSSATALKVWDPLLAGNVFLGLATGFPQQNPDGSTIIDPVRGGPARDLPQSERFYAGGDTTMRGFAVLSLQRSARSQRPWQHFRKSITH